MLKDVTGIKLSGANFDQETELDFFDTNNNEGKTKTIKEVLLYGRNGSGKSTIAKAFRKLAGEDIFSISKAMFLNCDGDPELLSEEEKKHIFVFDESYVDKKVKMKQDNLDTIIMLGPIANVEEKIKSAKADKDLAEKALDKQKDLCNEYCDETNKKSPLYYNKNIVDTLKGDDSWAGRDKEIHGKKINTSVTDDTYKKFMELKPYKSKKELFSEYESKIKELENAKTGLSTINTGVPLLSSSYSKYDDEQVNEALALKIEKPELSEREQKLIELVHQGGSEELSNRLKLFRNENIEECPYCYQPIKAGYKKSLVKSIEKVLSKAVEDHQKLLKDLKLSLVEINLEEYKNIEGYQKCLDLIKEINSSIMENNENLETKYNNPYEPIFVEPSSIKRQAVELVTALNNLEQNRLAYNNFVKKTEPIIEKLDQINAEIAYYDVKDFATQMNEKQDEYVEAKKKCNELQSLYEEKTQIVEDLEAQKSNIKIAVDVINACMEYIFFSENRLQIEYKDQKYILLSNGEHVRPCDISTGERNIIGLCYFFTCILEEKEEEEAYNDEYLIVLDDPISSFDYENRIGILSFLKYILSKFLEGNQHTKALVMTHNLSTFYDLEKMTEEIIKEIKRKNNVYTPQYCCYELVENNLKNFSINKRQEYTEMIKEIYEYASGKSGSNDIVIGNIMRQVLEAFSTFEYKKGIEEVSTDEKILACLPDKRYVPFFKNLMYRIVLNNGSHKQEQVKTLQNLDFSSYISEKEKVNTAKEVLCFIYLLNSAHILEHLRSYDDAKSTLESWCGEILKKSTII